MNMLKIKAEKIDLNKMYNKNTPKGTNVRFELQAKQHVK